MAEKRLPVEAARTRSATSPNWASLALLALALIAAAPLWSGPGLLNTRAGGDSPFLFIRLHQLVENLRAGVFPARWMPDAAYGLGYPFFNFYASLPYYLAALFNLIGFDGLASIKIVQSLGFVFAAWAMYGWARATWGSASAASVMADQKNGADRRSAPPLQALANDSFGDRRMAWLAAVAYTFAPFHLVNVYVRGDSLSEFYAFVFYPLILWAVDGVLAHPRPRMIALLGLAYAGLILTHNISALIFSPFILLYLIRHSAFRILHCALGLLLGLVLSAWFWLPALGEAPLVQLDAQTTGYFNYAGHFRSNNLVQSSPGFDYSTEPPHTPFAMGLAQAIATCAGVLALVMTWKRGSSRLRIFVLAGLIVSTLMITPVSRPLWDGLPLLSFTQFPWRFLSVQALFASLAIGYLAGIRAPATVGSPPGPVSSRAEKGARAGDQAQRRIQTALVGACGLALAMSTLLPLQPDYLPIRADEITPQRIQLYEAFTTNIGTTIRAEYLPRTTLPRPYTGPALIDPSAPPQAVLLRGEADAELLSRGPASQTWAVHAAGNSTLAFPTLHFAGWQAALDGRPLETRPAADLGYIQVDVPAGEHTLSLELGHTPLRSVAELVSLIALAGVLGILAFTRRRSVAAGAGNQGRSTAGFVSRLRSYVLSRRYEIGLLALAGAAAFAMASTNAVEARDDDLVMDFEAKPWLHHATSADFGWMARLVRYAIGEFSPGKPLSVSIEWAEPATASLNVTVQLVEPSLPAFGRPEPIASASAPLRAGVNTYALDIPAGVSRGLYYLRVELDAGRPVFLKPIVYTESRLAPGTAGWARIGDSIELKTVALKHDPSDRLTLAFNWVALRPIGANYAVSLRLQDAAGRAWVALDQQPGYGFRPTSVWLPGFLQHDTYTLDLPADMPRGEAFSLDIVWYRVASQQEIGRVRVPGISLESTYGLTDVPRPPRSFDVPQMQQRVDAVFGDAIKLLGYDLKQDGGQLALTLHWQALSDIRADYKFFVHVFDPRTEQIVAQADAISGDNAYPTSHWMKGEVVSETVDLSIGQAGTYRVATGWYDPVSADRLAATDVQGRPIAAGRLLLGDELHVP